MSKIIIGKKEYNVEEEPLNQCELLFYEENPRVYSILRSNGTIPTQKEIEAKMKSMEHVKQLRLSIEQNGGLIDPLIVVKRNGDYVVLEGNSRLAAYRLLAEKDPVKWPKVRANILPEEISENEIFTLLGQYHLVGRKDWNIFEQAAYLYRQKKSSGLENDDLRPDRWSYYEEYLKSRAIRKYRDTNAQIDATFVKQVKTGKIKQAMDVRVVLGEVAKTKGKTASKIMQDIIDEKVDIYDGHDRLRETGKTTNTYKQISKFHESITNEEFQSSLLLEATTNKDIKFELRKIQKAIGELLQKLN